MFDDIVKDCRTRWEKEAKLLTHVYELVDKGEIPCFLYKGVGGIHYRPLIDVNSNYGNRAYGKVMIVGSTGYRFNDGSLRRINNEDLRKVREIDREIVALMDKKQEMLKQVWRKNKKLSWQFAEEWDKEREKLLKEYGLKEE